MAKRILVPYDGSKSSDKAVRLSVEYAGPQKDAEIILLYVVPEIHLPPSYDYGMRISYVKSTKEYKKELYQKMKEGALEILGIKKSELRLAGIENVEMRVSTGSPVEHILDMARAEKVDLIIIGSVGLTGLSRLKALGSVSRGVSERAKCPVLIVH